MMHLFLQLFLQTQPWEIVERSGMEEYLIHDATNLQQGYILGKRRRVITQFYIHSQSFYILHFTCYCVI